MAWSSANRVRSLRSPLSPERTPHSSRSWMTVTVGTLGGRQRADQHRVEGPRASAPPPCGRGTGTVAGRRGSRRLHFRRCPFTSSATPRRGTARRGREPTRNARSTRPASPRLGPSPSGCRSDLCPGSCRAPTCAASRRWSRWRSALDLKVEEVEALSEGTPFEAALDLLDEVPEHTVLCSHGDVILATVDALVRRGLAVKGQPDWRKGANVGAEPRQGRSVDDRSRRAPADLTGRAKRDCGLSRRCGLRPWRPSSARSR